MKTQFTISSVMFGKVFINEKTNIQTQLVNINTLESIHQFKHDDDGNPVECEKRQIPIQFADFTRLLTRASWIGHIKKTKLTEEEARLPKEKRDSIEYADHVDCLNGAVVVIERTEIKETVYDESKPVVDSDGNRVLDDSDEQVYEPLLGEDDKPVTKVIGYKDLEIVSVTLSPEGLELAKDLAKTKYRH